MLEAPASTSRTSERLLHWRRADRVIDDADEASNGWSNPTAGLDVYRRATEEHPKDVELWLLSAGALAALERWSEAESVARNGLAAAGFDQDLWLLLLDALLAQGLADHLTRELKSPAAGSTHQMIVPIYEAKAVELRDPEDRAAILEALSAAYDAYFDMVRFDRAPRQPVLDLAIMLARHGARDEADYCLDTLSRSLSDDDEVGWQAAATGVALWQGVDDTMADVYRDRLLADGDRTDEEIEAAVNESAEAIEPA